MKDIFYNDMQKKLKKEAHEFAEKYITPRSEEYDRGAVFPIEVFREGRKERIMLGMIPKKYGGRGLNMTERFIIAEELSRACSGIAIAMQVQDACVIPFLYGGTEQQKKFYFSEMLKGKIFSMAFTEAEGGSDLGAVRTYAIKRQGKYFISGKKTLIASAKYSDYIIVFAKILDTDYYGLFIVDKNQSGVNSDTEYETMGQRANRIGEVCLDEVEVNEEDRIGPEDGLGVAMKSIEANRACCAAVAIGIGQRAMEECLEYVSKRSSFGKKIWKHQAVGHMIAEMAVNLQAARLLGIQGVTCIENKKDTEKYASYAKVFASETAMKVCTDAVQIFGGYGILKNTPVEKLFRDVKCCQIYEGTSQIQYDIIIRQLMRGGNI